MNNQKVLEIAKQIEQEANEHFKSSDEPFRYDLSGIITVNDEGQQKVVELADALKQVMGDCKISVLFSLWQMAFTLIIERKPS